MILDELCPPAILYIVFTITHIIIDIFKKLYNLAFIKFVVMIVFTLLLNVLCSQGLTIVSWLIVFLPFIFMTIITSLMLYTFELSPSRGKLDYDVQYPDNQYEDDYFSDSDNGSDYDSDSDSDYDSGGDDDEPRPYNNNRHNRDQPSKHRNAYPDSDSDSEDILPPHVDKHRHHKKKHHHHNHHKKKHHHHHKHHGGGKKIKRGKCKQVKNGKPCKSVGKSCTRNDAGCESNNKLLVGCAGCGYEIGCECSFSHHQ